MHSSSREEIEEDFDALHAAVSRIVGHAFEVLTTPERLALLERLEHETRRLAVPRHALINQIGEQSNSTELGGTLPTVLADRLRITRGEARRRVAEAADLGQRPGPDRRGVGAAADRDRRGPAGRAYRGRPCTGDPLLFAAAAGQCRPRDARARRSPSGRAGHQAWSRGLSQAGRAADCLPEP